MIPCYTPPKNTGKSLFLWCFQRVFSEEFKAFIKPFEAPQRSVKKKFNLIFRLRPGLGQEGLKRNEN